ncbi:MAG: HEAT repeat domain-containing protein, partial [Candidatus Obscuribacterales bacterium]|nr:HEAT repeat domain-containing protein [Candidatus Obscuribacterales bacterium]
RANAAVLLTFLNATQAVDTLIESLHDTAENTMLSFPHQAYALGKMGDKKAIEALSRYLSHDNSWMRADAMGALAQLTADEPFEPLMNALVVPHLLSDYSAIAVARQIAPQSLLTSDCEAAQAAGSAIIFGVIHASTATYTNDIVFETGVSECLPALTTLIKKAATPINIRAALALKDWIETADNRKYLDYDPKSELCYLSKFLEIDQIVELIIDKTLDPILDKPEELSCPLTASQAKSAVAIAGRLESSATGSRLVKMVTPEHPLLSEALDALSRLEHSEASTPLLDLALKLVDIEDRIAREPSKHPVKEQDETKSKHYWQALRAMGSVPTEPVQEFLLKASNDYAADKRQQARESLIRVSATLSASSK